MKYELYLFYNDNDRLSHAYRIFADKTREDLREDEIQLLQAAMDSIA